MRLHQKVAILTGAAAALTSEATAFGRPAANPSGARFGVNLDATVRNWVTLRGLRRLLPRIEWAMEGRILRSADLLACATEWVAGSAAGPSARLDRGRSGSDVSGTVTPSRGRR